MTDDGMVGWHLRLNGLAFEQALGNGEEWGALHVAVHAVAESDITEQNKARRANQSILKEFNPEYPLEGLMLKLKLQNFGHLM